MTLVPRRAGEMTDRKPNCEAVELGPGERFAARDNLVKLSLGEVSNCDPGASLARQGEEKLYLMEQESAN